MRKCRESISLHFLIFSPFPPHFLILSPFPRSPAARLQQFVLPCVEVVVVVVGSWQWAGGVSLDGASLLPSSVLFCSMYILQLANSFISRMLYCSLFSNHCMYVPFWKIFLLELIDMLGTSLYNLTLQ